MQDETPLQKARARVVDALRCAEEGSLDIAAVDGICRSLIEALRFLSYVQDEEAARQERPSNVLPFVSSKGVH